MIARGDWKYIYYVNERPSLFNLTNDPGEMHDLAQDAAHADVLQEFDQLLRTVVDPEAIEMQAKRDLGLIGPDGHDYTRHPPNEKNANQR